MASLHYKDAILDELAHDHNVAQFVSFGADGAQRYSRIQGLAPNYRFESPRDAVERLIRYSAEHAVNVRSFVANQPRSNEFIQNLKKTDDVLAHIQRLRSQGLVTIVNETIDISDGGVSGVATPYTLEFAPDSTPRAVEEEGIARLPRELGDRLLQTVYGFAPNTPTGLDLRLEFSIHPKPRGWLSTHTILWESESLDSAIFPARLDWPNKFSAFLGDKVYGLLVAWLIGLPVPRTCVVGRRFAPFEFGDDTGELEVWLRTAPRERTPGQFTTTQGWIDPFALLNKEDPTGHLLASVLSQRAVKPAYSGAAITEADGTLRVEGTAGTGDDFMLSGNQDVLPEFVHHAVGALNDRASSTLGSVSFEWVFDGKRAWIVQLHVGRSASQGDIIYPGDPEQWIEVSASKSLEELRKLVAQLDPQRTGVKIIGSIGTSSHKGDLLRKARIPSRLFNRVV